MGIDLGHFPYKTMRSSQKEVLQKLKDNWDKYDYFVLELPTGFGKSAVAKTLGASCNNAFLLTVTKQLQDQYINDFPDGKIKSVKGRNNYDCVYNERLTCDMGPCLINSSLLLECLDDNICPYYNARSKAYSANTALTSYQYFLRSTHSSRFWKPRDLLIMDECHLIEQQLLQFAEVFLLPRDLNIKYNIFEDITLDKFVLLSSPPEESGFKNNKKWLDSIWDLIVLKRKKMYEEIKDIMGGKEQDSLEEEELDKLSSTHSDYYDLDKLYKKLSCFFEANDKYEWIIEPKDDGLSIQPINIGNLFHRFMSSWSNKKVFMSATILDCNGFCENLNLPKDKTAIIKIESSFDPNRSPIIYHPVGNMNYSALENTIPNIINAVDEILKLHPNDKGIIHSGNYRIANEIVSSLNNDRLLLRGENENNEILLDKHITSEEPTVLISPSLTTGADLKDNLSRFQVSVKLPWPSLADKRVQRKIELSNNWYAAEMFRGFLQSSGRSTRSKDDWSVTYVLDSSFYKWIYKYRRWFPRQFHERIIWNKNEFNLNEFRKKIDE